MQDKSQPPHSPHAYSLAEREALYKAIRERRDMRHFSPGASVPPVTVSTTGVPPFTEYATSKLPCDCAPRLTNVKATCSSSRPQIAPSLSTSTDFPAGQWQEAR